eukprot:432901_1
MEAVKTNTTGLISLLRNALYSKKELFLRELISNALDAIIRVKTLHDHYQKKSYKPRITIIHILHANNLIITDNGIGMTKNDLENYLGTICNSGTKKYIQSLTTYTEAVDDMIGMFGIGFRSCYAIADKIVIKTKHINAEHDGYIMTFDESLNSFNIELNNEKIKIDHGTQIILTINVYHTDYMKQTVAKTHYAEVGWFLSWK